MSLMTLVAAGAVTLCAQFGLFPDDTKMGDGFELGGFLFRDLGSSPSIFVNETSGERGLQFQKAGVAVVFPTIVTSVDLRVGTFAGPVTVQGKNAAGGVVATQTVPATNRFVDIRLLGTDIASVELTEGGGEGLLAKICISVATCGCCSQG